MIIVFTILQKKDILKKTFYTIRKMNFLLFNTTNKVEKVTPLTITFFVSTLLLYNYC